MDVLMLGAFTTATSVAYYSLAGAIAAASGFPVIGLSTALFHRMVGRGEIKRQWLLVAWAVGLSSAALAWVFAAPFIDAVFSHRYSPAVRLVAPLALAQAIRGVTSVYNSFLSAQARGTELRNTGVILTFSNIVLNFALIPPFGATGAAWASLIALIANLFAHVFYYRRSLANGRDSGSPPTATSLVVDPTRDG
jgi:O-antigen/teichoic acid export membrane protein